MADTTTTNYALVKPEVNVSTTWPTSLNSDLDAIDAELAKPRIVHNSPTVGATTTCDLSLARLFAFTVTQATTLAFSNVPSSSFAVFVDLLITNGSAFVLTWPGSITWLQGVAPSLQASGVDRVRLVTKDGGTTWYGVHFGKNLSISGSLKAGVGSSTSQAKPTLVLHQSSGNSTGSGAEVSVTSYSLPANALAVNGQAIRITAVGTLTGASPGLALIKFGATTVATEAITNGTSFRYEIIVTRTGAATQSAASVESNNGTFSGAFTSPAETLSGAITIDFRGNTGGSGALTYLSIQVEHLAS